jgi:hypothetical protein
MISGIACCSCEDPGRNHSLTELSFHGCEMGDEVIMPIMEMLLTHRSVKHLDFATLPLLLWIPNGLRSGCSGSSIRSSAS